jgi:Na+-transporting methylmalonyl-CoA/oxaloacetate decarboxylase gamma subunit
LELFWQAFTIMTVGMGLVFLFLYIVVRSMSVSAWFVARWEKAHAAEPEDNDRAGAVIAAISAAVHEENPH